MNIFTVPWTSNKSAQLIYFYVVPDTHDLPIMYDFKRSPPSPITINLNNALDDFD